MWRKKSERLKLYAQSFEPFLYIFNATFVAFSHVNSQVISFNKTSEKSYIRDHSFFTSSRPVKVSDLISDLLFKKMDGVLSHSPNHQRDEGNRGHFKQENMFMFNLS